MLEPEEVNKELEEDQLNQQDQAPQQLHFAFNAAIAHVVVGLKRREPEGGFDPEMSSTQVKKKALTVI